jgi:hypothetical protein
MAMGHRLGSWVPAVCLALPAALGCAGDEAPTDLYELSGFVRETPSGSPIDGATVLFVSDTLYSTETSTDEDGFYEMVVETDTPFGQVRARRSGYIAAEQTVFFDSSERRIDLVLRVEPAMMEED